ncbi:MAG: hypothetical protein P8Y23_03635 [Candidatus Lokiarchaeota archaeon]|jgi:uncharacterized Zn finger protein (UPF0148 family)
MIKDLSKIVKPLRYHCPRCGSSFLVISETEIFCVSCQRFFNREECR